MTRAPQKNFSARLNPVTSDAFHLLGGSLTRGVRRDGFDTKRRRGLRLTSSGKKTNPPAVIAFSCSPPSFDLSDEAPGEDDGSTRSHAGQPIHLADDACDGVAAYFRLWQILLQKWAKSLADASVQWPRSSR